MGALFDHRHCSVIIVVVMDRHRLSISRTSNKKNNTERHTGEWRRAVTEYGGKRKGEGVKKLGMEATRRTTLVEETFFSCVSLSCFHFLTAFRGRTHARIGMEIRGCHIFIFILFPASLSPMPLSRVVSLELVHILFTGLEFLRARRGHSLFIRVYKMVFFPSLSLVIPYYFFSIVMSWNTP